MTYTIAWDVDDVLNDLTKSWLLAFYKSNCRHNEVLYSQIKENPPYKILNISLNEYLQSLDDFRLSESAISMEPNYEILSWLKEKGHLYKHLALTATPLKTAHISAFWVTKHFGSWIQSFNFVPSKREDDNFPVQHRNKQDFLNWIKHVDILIDDNENNIKEAEEIGVKGILIARPWNNCGYSINEALELLEKIAIEGGLDDKSF